MIQKIRPDGEVITMAAVKCNTNSMVVSFKEKQEYFSLHLLDAGRVSNSTAQLINFLNIFNIHTFIYTIKVLIYYFFKVTLSTLEDVKIIFFRFLQIALLVMTLTK